MVRDAQYRARRASIEQLKPLHRSTVAGCSISWSKMPSLCHAFIVVSLLLLVQHCDWTDADQAIPHVSECNFCFKCHTGAPSLGAGSGSGHKMLSLDGSSLEAGTAAEAEASSGLQLQPSSIEQQHVPSGAFHSITRQRQRKPSRELRVNTHLSASYLPRTLVPEDFSPSKEDVLRKQTLPNCTECHGCNTQLEHMVSETEFLGHTFTNEKGATSSWLFRAQTNRTASGHALVKVYCVPISKTGSKVARCGAQYVMNVFQIFLAVEKLAEECGFEDIVPKLWIDKVDAVMPETGYHIRWYGVWMEIAEGISLENLLKVTLPTPSIEAERLEDLFNDKLNKTQVFLAAVHDLLTCQCDRHAQNVMISESGNFKLIDNEWSWQFFVNPCAMDSIFLGTTQKQEITRLGNAMVLKQVTKADYHGWHTDPQLLLDYRCWVEGGEIGTNFPPRMKQCLKRISEMSAAQVEEAYGLPNNLTATNLLQRASDLYHKGYEWTLKYGKPRNPAPKTYKLQPSCCEVRFNNTIHRWACAHEWQPSWDLPYGDPIIGWSWKKEGPDPGSYEGGTAF